MIVWKSWNISFRDVQNIQIPKPYIDLVVIYLDCFVTHLLLTGYGVQLTVLRLKSPSLISACVHFCLMHCTIRGVLSREGVQWKAESTGKISARWKYRIFFFPVPVAELDISCRQRHHRSASPQLPSVSILCHPLESPVADFQVQSQLTRGIIVLFLRKQGLEVFSWHVSDMKNRTKNVNS